MRPFFQSDYFILSVSKIRNVVSNKIIEITPSDKLIYVWMIAQYCHLKSQKKEMFYNIVDISLILDVSESLVTKFIKKFKEAGILEIKKKKIKGFISSNSYIIHDISSHPFDIEFNKNIPAIYKKFILSDIQDNKKPVDIHEDSLPF